MGVRSKAKAVTAGTRVDVADALWSVPVAMYRLSGRRLSPSSQLYRAGILRQRFLSDRIPGMTAATERAYFSWHARETFIGRGTIVDLGSGFGSTSVALARGLQANPRSAAKAATIHAFDRFVWETWMEPYARAAGVEGYTEGDTFLPEFEATVAPWRKRIQVHHGDLLEATWSGEGIELLLVDAMKSWDLASQIVTQFFPALLGGVGYLIHQDYSHCFTPWIHLVSYRLRDHLVLAQDVERAETVAFRLARPFEDGHDRLNLTRASFDDAEVEDAFRYSLAITRPEKHSGIHAARVLLVVYDGDLDKAASLLRALENERKLGDFHAQTVAAAIEGARRDTSA
jgi:hypothetical protein